MDIKRLKYFVTIVEEGKISTAAKKLNIAQPPLSQQLKLLEEELDLVLFERHTRKLMITEEGKLLYEKALKILELIKHSKEEMLEVKQGFAGTVKLGAVSALGAKLLPETVKRFQILYPNVTFKMWDGDSNRIMELIDQRIIEFGLVRYPIDKEIFHTISLPSEPIVAAIHRSRNFHPDKSIIKVSDLKDQPLMVLRSNKGTSNYNTPIDLVDMLKDACNKNDFEPTIFGESSNIMPLLSWLNHDIGIAIVPESAHQLMLSDDLVIKKILNPELRTRSSALIWLKDRQLSTVSQKFIDLFVESFFKDNIDNSKL